MAQCYCEPVGRRRLEAERLAAALAASRLALHQRLTSRFKHQFADLVGVDHFRVVLGLIADDLARVGDAPGRSRVGGHPVEDLKRDTVLVLDGGRLDGLHEQLRQVARADPLAEIPMPCQRVILAPVRERGDAEVAWGADPDLHHLQLARPILWPHLANRRVTGHARGADEPQVLVGLLRPDQAATPTQ
jgi:hypothetical protein